MKTLVYGAGPIGRWLALRLQVTGHDVTLLARGQAYQALQEHGVDITDGLTGERHAAPVKLIERLDPDDPYDLVVVPMQKASRLAVCPILARNTHLKHILFMGNDVSGIRDYLDYLPKDKVLLGFPGVGGGWDGGDLVILDREKPRGPHGMIYLGELDGTTRARTRRIKRLFEAADIMVSLEKDMAGWLKYHFAFMAPTTGVIFMKGGDLHAVAADADAIHQYCRACREAGDVLRAVGYHKRQPAVFNLYYWLPRWLEPKVFSKFFSARTAAIRFGLHAPTVGPELRGMAVEFDALKAEAGIETPTLDALLAYVPRTPVATHQKEVTL